MKFFITGITGFIGSNLARELVTDGHTVNAIIRGKTPEEFRDHPRICFFQSDLHDIDVLKSAMEGCDIAFHLAAFARPWSKDPDYHRHINVMGTAKVFSAALESGIKKVVFTSSAAIMSPSLKNQSSNEETPRHIPYFNAYESTKAEVEQLAREYCNKGLPVVIVNPSRVYGPGPINPSNSVTKMIAGYYNGTWRIIPGDGTKIGNYVFIDDVVHGHILAAQKGVPGERYILGGENLTFDEFFKVLQRVSGKQRMMVHLPVGAMEAAAILMEWQARLTGIKPLITADFVKKYMNHWSLSSEKATRELGYRITPFSRGVEMTLEWLGYTRPFVKSLISQP
jgi:farnesol dehydrogenase